MENITLAIKFNNGDINIFSIPSNLISELINDVRLYENDISFINKYLSDKVMIDRLIPSGNGLLIIDMVTNKILDNQNYTSVFKITPMEIKLSYLKDNKVVERFKAALNSNRLKGFEEWYDKGTKINYFTLLDIDNIYDFVNSMNNYGQFIFDTSPYTVLTYSDIYFEDQRKLFKYLLTHNYIHKDSEDYRIWQEKLNALKNANN